MQTVAQAAKRSATSAPKLSNQDLRTWIDALRAAGELQEINGAEREAEIGGIVDLYMRKMGNRAVLFDDIPGYPHGHRILANILTSVRRINLTVGMPLDASAIELVSYWRKYMKEARSFAPVKVKSGPLMENVSSGKNVNIEAIPTPRWHEHDGGYYIGTGCMVIMKDPDTGWINYGAYRVQYQGPNVATVMCSKGKHGDLIKRRYHEHGEPCPIAVVAGMHPALFMVGGLEIPYGKNEYDVAGIETFMHRHNPILLGAVPAVPPDDDSFYRGTYRSGAVWNQLEAAGVPEVKGVWAHAAGGSRLWLTVSIKQQYAGHAKQAGLIASQCHAGAYANRFVVVVDDDIDPADMDQVVWAMCTRFDPREGMETLRGCWSTALDPMAYGSDDPRNARVVIDACKPWSRRDSFPRVARATQGLVDRIRTKWAHVLPRG
jgi:4-hydroxy-3-polyprenylbenzoate decarboxylase